MTAPMGTLGGEFDVYLQPKPSQLTHTLPIFLSFVETHLTHRLSRKE